MDRVYESINQQVYLLEEIVLEGLRKEAQQLRMVGKLKYSYVTPQLTVGRRVLSQEDFNRNQWLTSLRTGELILRVIEASLQDSNSKLSQSKILLETSLNAGDDFVSHTSERIEQNWTAVFHTIMRLVAGKGGDVNKVMFLKNDAQDIATFKNIPIVKAKIMIQVMLFVSRKNQIYAFERCVSFMSQFHHLIQKSLTRGFSDDEEAALERHPKVEPKAALEWNKYSSRPLSDAKPSKELETVPHGSNNSMLDCKRLMKKQLNNNNVDEEEDSQQSRRKKERSGRGVVASELSQQNNHASLQLKKPGVLAPKLHRLSNKKRVTCVYDTTEDESESRSTRTVKTMDTFLNTIRLLTQVPQTNISGMDSSDIKLILAFLERILNKLEKLEVKLQARLNEKQIPREDKSTLTEEVEDGEKEDAETVKDSETVKEEKKESQTVKEELKEAVAAVGPSGDTVKAEAQKEPEEPEEKQKPVRITPVQKFINKLMPLVKELQIEDAANLENDIIVA